MTQLVMYPPSTIDVDQFAFIDVFADGINEPPEEGFILFLEVNTSLSDPSDISRIVYLRNISLVRIDDNDGEFVFFPPPPAIKVFS